MTRKIFSVEATAAIILVFGGVTTIIGWITRTPAVVQLHPDFIGMVFSTAACYMAAGIALLLPVFDVPSAARLQQLVGKALTGIAATILLGYLAGFDTPLNLSFLHAWLQDGNPVPGRMAPGAAVAFFLIGLVLILMHRVQSKAAGGAIQIATFILLVLGFVGLASYALRLELLYPWMPAPRIAIQSTVCIIVAGIGLWGQWRNADWYRTQRYFRDDEKTGYVAATILTVIALTAGIVGFSVQQATLGRTLGENLQAQLRNETTLFRTVVHEGLADAAGMAARPHLIQLTRALARNTNDTASAAQLLALGRSILASRYTGVVIYDAGGRELLRLGRFTQQPEIEVELGLSWPAMLIWDDGVLINTRVPLLHEQEEVGAIMLEQPLPVITRQLAQTEGFGKTGELGICARRADRLTCFPQRRNPTVHSIPLLNDAGKMRPMTHAAEGRTGITDGVDYRGVSVIAAYGPLTASGLGIVVKQDAEELYQPIREQLNMYLPLLLLLVIGGGMLLRSQVKPLVTKLLRSERDARARELHIRTVVDNIAEGIITLDEAGNIASFNQAASRIFGYSVEEAIGMSMTAMMPPDMRHLHDAGMQRYMRDGQPRFVGMGIRELPALHKNGTIFPLELAITEMHDEEHRLFVGIVRDISERKKAAEQVQHLAHFDLLTDLPNRVLLGDRIKQALAKAKRDGSRMALLFIDLDKFKPVNDTFGHNAGDLLLKQVADRLRGCLRESDTVARVGGDEFIVLLPQVDAAPYAVLVADKILAALNERFHIDGHDIGISGSIGVAVYPDDGEELNALMKNADSAMYHAKESGAARVVAFAGIRQAADPVAPAG